MKKLLLSLALMPAFLLPKAPSPSWPTALSVPFMVAMATGAQQDTMESLADGLDFTHSRSIECNFDVGALSQNDADEDDEWQEPSSPLSAKYELRWGYKGAGDATKPFAGIRGRVQVQVSYEGLSFQLCKSKSLRRKIYKTLGSVLTVSPCEEFYLKLAQLAWTVSQGGNSDLGMVREGLETLFARLKLTEGGMNCKLYGMQVLNSPSAPGLELFLSQAPEQFAQRFVLVSQKIGAAFSLIAGSPRNPEKRAYLRSLMAQIDYYQDGPFRLNLPKGGTITLPFDHVGSGDASEPFSGTTMVIEVPKTRMAGAAVAKTEESKETTVWEMQISPRQEFTARLVLLILHRRKNRMPSYKFTEALSTLLARLNLTPRTDGKEPGYLDALVEMICQYHQYVMHYDFSQPLNEELDSQELLLQLARVAYKTYTLNEDRTFDKDSGISAQEVADFATKHTADALRCYRGVVALKEQAQERTRVPYLEKKGVRLNVGLFVKTLMSPSPGDETDAAEA